MLKFTIITCTWNAARDLPPTLRSVLRQSYPEVEHLIVDGASTDATVSLARRYKEESDQAGGGHDVTVISERDGGLYDAMNKGIGHATGDYVLFLNAGDTFPAPDTLARVAACAEDGGTELPGVLYGDTDIVDRQGRFLRHRRLRPPRRLSWRSFCRGMLVCHQAFYARTDLAREQPYDLHYRFSADFDWCIRVMRAARDQRLALRNTHMVVACFLEGGMTTRNHRASLRERFRIMARHYGLPVALAMHLWFVLRAVMRP